jgi:hypothetical protein
MLKNVLIGAALLTIVFFAWMLRYDAKPVPNTLGLSLVTDRWTGRVYKCGMLETAATPDGCARQFWLGIPTMNSGVTAAPRKQLECGTLSSHRKAPAGTAKSSEGASSPYPGSSLAR